MSRAFRISLRNRVLSLVALVSGITYLDRVCLSAAAPTIMRDLRLSNMQMGYAFSVFALAYGIFEIPMGWLGDRLGQRKMLTRIVACWSAFTALTGMAGGYLTLLSGKIRLRCSGSRSIPFHGSLSRALVSLDRSCPSYWHNVDG